MSYKFDTYKGWEIVWVAGDRCYAENIHGDVINHDVVRSNSIGPAERYASASTRRARWSPSTCTKRS